MASLAALVNSYRKRKIEASKLRKIGENKLKEALSKKRRSSSGLAAIERKKEDLIRQRSHLLQVLNQHLAQKDSIDRLRIAAEERLKLEQDNLDQLKQQSEYGGHEEKTAAIDRLKYVEEKIAELQSEIKSRDGTQTRLAKEIESCQRDEIKVDQQLKKLTQTKPALLAQLKAGTSAEGSLRSKVQSLIKHEAQTSNALSIVQKKLAVILVQKRLRMAKIAAQRRKRLAKIAAQKRKRLAILAAKKRKLKRKAKTKLKAKLRTKAKRKITTRKLKSRTKKAIRRKILKRKAKKKSKSSRRR